MPFTKDQQRYLIDLIEKKEMLLKKYEDEKIKGIENKFEAIIASSKISPDILLARKNLMIEKQKSIYESARQKLEHLKKEIS